VSVLCLSVHPRCCLYDICGIHSQIFSSASWDRDELIRFWGQKVKGHPQGLASGRKHTELDAVASNSNHQS